MPDDSSFFTVASPTAAKAPPIIEGDAVENIAYDDPAPPWSGKGFKSKLRQEWEARNPQWRETWHPPRAEGKTPPGASPGGFGGTFKPKADKPKVKGDPFLAQLIQLGHAIAAGGFHSERIAIDEEEAQILADAIAGVAAHYGVTLMQENKGPWGNFAKAIGLVYGPRMAEAALDMLKRPRAPKRTAPAQPQAKPQPATANPGLNPNDPELFNPSLYVGV